MTMNMSTLQDMNRLIILFERVALALEEANRRSYGENGKRFIDSGFTQPTNEIYKYFTVITEATLTYTDTSGGDSVTVSKTFPVGYQDWGHFTVIDVTAGEIAAYIK